MISMDKEYRTRDGREVRLMCLDKKDEAGYSVVALITEPCGREMLGAFTSDGLYLEGQKSSKDLIEVKPRIIRYGWLNIYPGYMGRVYGRRKNADDIAGSDRIACVRVTIDCEHGEGLNDKESQ